MGLLIDREQFTDEDFSKFSERLAESVTALGYAIQRKGFGVGPTTIGAELELFLVDGRGQALPVNLEVLERCRDPRLTVEISRYNLELNLTPQLLEGRPFTALAGDMRDALVCTKRAASEQGARIVFVGILPTLRTGDVGRNALTPLPRYRALNEGIKRSRGNTPFRIHVKGEELLDLSSDDVAVEGANTSLQFHLRVPPDRYADTFNAAQLATAPVLAMAVNAPFFLGKKLWDETRVALFRQATDDRGELPSDWTPPARVSFGRGWVRKGAQELFAEAVALHVPLIPVVSEGESPIESVARGRVPGLAELRLHNGTVWCWNRAIYDPHDEGHLRIEFRALPAGPTVADMMANGAFMIGLTLGLAPMIESLLPGVPFLFARANFQHAARAGLDAELLWPTPTAPSPRPIKVTDLLPELLEIAGHGLQTAGVEKAEYEPLLEIIRARAAQKITGARWQRRALEAFEAQMPRQEALARVLDRYMALSEEGRPVHEWPAM